jgi:hypothetical protein
MKCLALLHAQRHAGVRADTPPHLVLCDGERRKTMNFVCEVPVLIEQRLFALARAIQQSLE